MSGPITKASLGQSKCVHPLALCCIVVGKGGVPFATVPKNYQKKQRVWVCWLILAFGNVCFPCMVHIVQGGGKARCKTYTCNTGGGEVCQGTISMGIISEGENFGTSRNPEACWCFMVGSGWILLFPDRLPMVPDISLETNTSLSLPSAWCTAAHV